MKKTISRLLFFLTGMVILVIGVVLCSKVQFGMAPFDSFVLNTSIGLGIKYGTVNILVGCLFVLLQILVLRKEFKVISLIQIVFLVLISVIMDFFMYRVFAFEFSSSMMIRVPLFVLGLTMISLGIGMFMSAQFYSFPLETLIALLYEKYHLKVSVIKWAIDAIFLVLSFGICLWFQLPDFNIGLGTIILFLAVGPLINLFFEKCKTILAKVSE